jgi:hypothetical protein
VNGWAEIRDACVLLEDEAVLVLDKPAGISVVGERHETDLVGLARDAGERLLPVHRIDKVTSGVVLLAKEPRIHADLTRQLARRTVDKVYLVVTRSGGLPAHGTIELPLSVGRKNRVRVAAQRSSIVADEARHRWSVPPSEVFTHSRTYPSLTDFASAWGMRATPSLPLDRSPAAGISSGSTWPGSGTPSRATRCSTRTAGLAPPGRRCTRGGSRSTRHGLVELASGWRPRRGRTSGPRCVHGSPAAPRTPSCGVPAVRSRSSGWPGRQEARPAAAKTLPIASTTTAGCSSWM